MGTIYEEFDEAKAEVERLKADYRIKVELSESLKRAHNEQLIKFQEANLKADKLSQELNEKAEEIYVANQMFKELESNFKEKEAVIRQLSCANEKLRADCKEKLKSSEEENKALALALDEASTKNMDQEQLISSLKEEIERLKGNASVSQYKCSEDDRRSKGFKARQSEDVLLKLEEEKNKYENQLKWKKEQFGHLEEAHKKLRHEFQVSQKEWERERVSLLDEISKLQTNLDSQTRISVSLQSRLEMCNQALAHEQSKRKYLEVQLSESQAQFDNVFAEYEGAKSTIESLTGQRDKEIASLRSTLGTRESFYKEMEYQVKMLEQEKQELLASLRELQEAQIHGGGGSSSSLKKLRNKLRGLEQVHQDCSARLASKEAEWNSQLQTLTQKLSGYSAELESKNTVIDQLKMEAEAHNSMILQLALHNEEAAFMVLVLKAGLLDAQMKLAEAYLDLDHNKVKTKDILSLFRGLEQVHRECSSRLKSKEAEWDSQREILMLKINCCCSELESKNTLIDQLKMEAEANDSMIEQLALHNEEAAFTLFLLKLGFLEAHMKVAEAYDDLDLKHKQSEESQALLLAQLEMKNGALLKAQSDLEEERKKVAHLSGKVESLNFIEEQQLMQHKELERLEKMLSESHTCQCELNKQVLSMNSELKEVRNALKTANQELDEKTCGGIAFGFELHLWKSFAEQLKKNLEENCQLHREVEASLHAQVVSLKSDLIKAFKTLDRANEELAERFHRGNEAEFELQIWNSIAEQLKANLEENYQMRREVEASLLEEVAVEVNLKQEREGLLTQLEERDKRIEDLLQQITLLNQDFGARGRRSSTPASTKRTQFDSSEKRSTPQNTNENSDEEEEWVKRAFEGAILAQVDAVKNHEHEKESLHHLVEERDQRIEQLQQLVRSLEQEFESSTSSFGSRLSDMQVEINLFHESWNKIATALVLKEIEIQEKNSIIFELEKDLTYSEAGSQADKSEILRLRDELEKQQTRSDVLIEKLNAEKGKITEEVVKLSSERENLLDTLGGLFDKMHHFSMQDMQLMESLRNMSHKFDSTASAIDIKEKDENFDPVKENKILYASPRTSKSEATVDERFPLRTLNNEVPL